MEQVRLLVIEDEKPIAELLEYGLGREGFQVLCAQTAGAAIAAAAQFRPQAVLLDWMLPDMDGLELCRILSAEYNVPVLMLTARADMEDKLRGLESGADDYITKPFDLREVIMRIRAVLRRVDKARGTEEPESEAAPLTISEPERLVMRRGRLVELTPKEYELLEVLIRNRNIALSRERLLDMVWGYDFDGGTRTVDVHIQRLRHKLHLEEAIRTVYKLGYRLEV